MIGLHRRRTSEEYAERRFARSLRTYLSRRSNRRLANTHMRRGVGCSSSGDGATPIKRHGSPWCPTLGPDTSILNDPLLQAVFATWDAIDDEAVWRMAARNSSTTFRSSQLASRLRAEGERLLKAAVAHKSSNALGFWPTLTGGPLQDLFLPSYDTV